ncbi:MAG: chromosome partitioning protein [Treponemataceae bacterium]
MELPPDNLYGMTPAAAREYIAAYISTKLLNEKKLAELEGSLSKWTDRAALARSKGIEDLAAAADVEIARISGDRDKLGTETQELSAQIDTMRRQLPGLSARERSIDPDLLEQELLIAAGRTPGDEAEQSAVDAERKLASLEKHTAADDQLAALKERLAKNEGDDQK